MEVRVECPDARFLHELRLHYAGFIEPIAGPNALELVVEPLPPPVEGSDAELEVRLDGGLWILERGDFRAEWNPSTARGTVRLHPNRYSLDSVLRIIHSLELARTGQGLLLHGASAVRNGKGFVFSGPSGAGKTTIARLAPAGVRLLTDEISYVHVSEKGFDAWGTPFAGELAQPGENIVAPLSALYFLRQSGDNRIEAVRPAEALRLIMRNTLFFAHDQALVAQVLDLAGRLAESVEVAWLDFTPDIRVWSLIR